ncbi:hypothetical protein Bca4012_063110 [Brassica carinata]
MEIVPVMEQQSVVEKESSYGGNYSELARGLPEVEGNPGALTLFTRIEEAELYLPGDEGVENFVNGEADERGINIVNGEAGEGGIGMDNIVDNEGDVDNSMGVRPVWDYVELPRVAKEIPVVKEWEDGLGIELFQEFPSKEAVKDMIDRASQLNCFGISISNSDKSRYVVKCRLAAEGCKWGMRATKINNSEVFTIRTYMKMHSCSRATSCTGFKRKVTPRCVASIVHKDYPGLYETPSAKTLLGLVKRKLEKVNPDTKTSLLLDEHNRFKYLFVALGASIEGFEFMRKVITVDATFLKTVEGGCLVIATAQDPNLHHYPIAFGVVDGDKKESWNWFFTTLKTVIPDSTELVFVSDRNAGLIKVVAEVYPLSKHGYCIWHLSHNVKGHVRQGRDEVAKQFRKIACLYSEAEFEIQLQDFRERYPACGTHRKDAAAGPASRKLVPVVENKIHDRTPKGSRLDVIPLNTFELEYRVIGADGKTYLVDLHKKTCMWALAYRRTVYPVPHMSDWMVPKEVADKCPLPPEYLKKKGRHRENRFPSAGETRRELKEQKDHEEHKALKDHKALKALKALKEDREHRELEEN